MKDVCANRMTIDEARREISRSGAAGLADRLGAIAVGNPLNATTQVDYRVPEGLTGQLAGLPIAVKDNVDVLGFATTGASPALKNFRPGADAPVVARLKAAGAWVPAKLNMHELAFGITSDNAAYGRVINPFDAGRTAGGSSGGSGAAVAAGLVPVALGTDTGASVRIPAAFCGTVGLRPSTGRYSTDGVIAISWMRDTIGVLANSVSDISEIDAVICPDDAADITVPRRPLRLGLPADALPGYCPATEDRFRAALEELVSGGTVEIVPLPALGYEEIQSRFDAPTAQTEALTWWREFCTDKLEITLQEFREGLASPDVVEIFATMEAAASDGAVIYRDLVRKGRSALQACIGALFTQYEIDLIAAPTSPVQPPKVEDYSQIKVRGELRPTLPVVVQNTSLATIAGTPSLTLPAGFDADGLPVGLMLEAPIGCDRQLLAMAARIEAELSPGCFESLR